MLGAIADDYTGGTDVAVAFRRAGLRAIVLFGVPEGSLNLPPHDAIVVALKTRTIDVDEAVRQSLEAAEWLRAHGADQLFFKYCSTFDSKAEGNIGPVADALADLIGSPLAAVAPSSPEHHRTQYMGHLFVAQQLLSDSPMRHHPLTPMTDSRIVRVLESQTERPVALVAHQTVRQGREAIRLALDALVDDGIRYAVIDAVSDEDLVEIGYATAGDVLVTGAAGLAGGIGAARVALRDLDGVSPIAQPTDTVGNVPAAVLAGSCSARTLEQVAVMRRHHDNYRLNAVEDPDPQRLADAALAWYDSRPRDGAPLIYSSLPPADLRETQRILGTERSAHILETAMGLIARGLVERGVRRLVVAGGETSGAVVSALHVDGGLIGDEVAPGVPWIYSTGDEPLALLLKSGNFGSTDLLERAVEPHLAEAASA
jgi:3-dehydrotetronate 4-kinase